MKVLLLGANGQLGTDLVKMNPSQELVCATRADADVTDAEAVLALVRKHRPHWIVNTTAYNRTEDCEDDPYPAFTLNAGGALNAARAAAEVGARLVHVSTDFVFDGTGADGRPRTAPYVESDAPNPLSVYAKSKREGEAHVLRASPDNLVVRGASLFGAAGSSGKGGNFIEAVLKKARSGQPVSVVSDIVMSPTYTRDMAVRIWQLMDRRAPGGLWHVTNGGECSWHAFAAEAFRLVGLPAPAPVPASAYPTRMRRAPYTALASERLDAVGLQPLRSWREALRSYLVEKGHVLK